MLNIATETTGVLSASEELMVKRALATLHAHYPGHIWGVDIDVALMTIRNKYLGNWGYRINLLMSDNIERECMIAGGECLERFNQLRGSANQDKIREMKTDARGNPVPVHGR